MPWRIYFFFKGSNFFAIFLKLILVLDLKSSQTSSFLLYHQCLGKKGKVFVIGKYLQPRLTFVGGVSGPTLNMGTKRIWSYQQMYLKHASLYRMEV
jgi:hypothetical protein